MPLLLYKNTEDILTLTTFNCMKDPKTSSLLYDEPFQVLASMDSPLYASYLSHSVFRISSPYMTVDTVIQIQRFDPAFIVVALGRCS